MGDKSEDEIINQLEDISQRFEAQYNKFIRDTEGENYFQIILRAHLYIEHELRILLTNNLKHPEIIGDRIKFTEITRLVFALGLLPLEEMPSINRINKLRNAYAHNLGYEIDEREVNSLLDSLSEKQKSSFKRFNKETKDLITILKNALYIIWINLIETNIIPNHIRDYLNKHVIPRVLEEGL
ncbi:hypothetical protein D7Z26_10295 [Cohnella endophytica]|uniref:Uncharacterized protein n=1 Tax=Cohnella endophytica TaxID=2419778 RepID=A0A494Y2B0_9BACL|nr:hypothetical protein [Cohnella endophytica]RKP55563.1 hypothetical protein D7Z26_10295 [Cohnella endophytica]